MTFEARLGVVTTAMARPDPDDDAWYSRATQLAAPDAAAIGAAFDVA